MEKTMRPGGLELLSPAGNLDIFKAVISAGADGVAIHFKVGQPAKDAALALATTALEIVDGIGCKAEDAPRSVANTRADDELKTRLLKQATRRLAASMPSETIAGREVVCGSLPGTDRVSLTELAESVKARGGVALIVGVTDTLSVIMASGNPSVDCRKLLPEILKRFGGRGGGKTDFAQGGVQDATLADEVSKALKETVIESLTS